MTIEFNFIEVPYNHDGSAYGNIFDGDAPIGSDPNKYLKPGVIISKQLSGLSLNREEFVLLNKGTGGIFIELIENDFNNRYILLTPRREIIKRLKKFATILSETRSKFLDEKLQKFLTLFIHDAEITLKNHGDKAALLIM